MPADPSPTIRPGDLAWLDVHGDRGGGKRRPVVVVAVDAGLAVAIVVACTSTPADPDSPALVPLPWHPTGSVGTRLRRAGWAVPSWIARVPVADLHPSGRVSIELLRRILSLTPNLPGPT